MRKLNALVGRKRGWQSSCSSFVTPLQLELSVTNHQGTLELKWEISAELVCSSAPDSCGDFLHTTSNSLSIQVIGI